MFRSAENLRLAADMRALQRVAAPWRAARRTWFDGTPESIEGRLAATERVLTHARSGLTPAHMALEREASTARAELKEASHRLMVDFLDDGARAFKGSKRVGVSYPDPGWLDEHDRRMDFMDWAGLPFNLSDEDEDYDEYKHLTSDNPESKAHLYDHPEVYGQDPDWRVKRGSKRVALDYDMVECSQCGKEIPDDGNQVVDTSKPGSYTHDKKGGTLEDFCPDCMPKKYKRRKSAGGSMASPGEGGSAIAPVEMGGAASASIPGAIGKMLWNGSTMTGQEPSVAFNAGPGVTPKISRHGLIPFESDDESDYHTECPHCDHDMDAEDDVCPMCDKGRNDVPDEFAWMSGLSKNTLSGPNPYSRETHENHMQGRNAALLPDFDDSLLFGD
jgi:hypothetical protein